ncbi:hypothetical protein CEUSTIGMA_g6460.t1 [Chlamydomonas eustigma]|uniref:Peptidase S54 rhomboid domain-containing protein n=1 Tax=Chlamydomonas eustigma TaxID=1157962 RepID=A0A250X8C6_9CHLO|nr:hypothetical protein CEUSTIGMA_g6460.t1 [Chlamydomonas eustigma]|eukprot:GAX79020.1 hypothetical protein CEUSTIGMA_g6460.t1 [Chlamydomonas eustigma]
MSVEELQNLVSFVWQEGALAKDRASSILSGYLQAITEQTVSSKFIIKNFQEKTEQLGAKWLWSDAISNFQPRLPYSTEMNEQLILLTCVTAAFRVLRMPSLHHEQNEQVTLQPGVTGSGTVTGEDTASIRSYQNQPPHHFLLPPVTLGLTLACVGLFYKPGGVAVSSVCLSPYCIVEKHEYARLLLPVLFHADSSHLLGNLASMIPDCAERERSVGSEIMAVQLLTLTTLSHGLYVLWAVIERHAFKRTSNYYFVGAVGLSSLALAVQVVQGVDCSHCELEDLSPGTASMQEKAGLYFGFPRRFAWAAQLLIAHVFSGQGVSLNGHLCGAAAGLLYAYFIQPGLRAGFSLLQGVTEQTNNRIIDDGGHIIVRVVRRNRLPSSKRWPHVRVWLLEMGIQVGVLATVAGLCNMYTRHQSAHNKSTASSINIGQLIPVAGSC